MRLNLSRKHCSCLAILLLVLSIPNSLRGGLRGPGKYSGVVIFDHWDTCFLMSGPYITYISDAVKEELRPYADTAVQIDAIEVTQPMNPGDALVHKYKIIGPPPDPKYISLEGLELNVTPDFGSGKPAFILEFRNIGASATWLRTDEVGINLLSDNKPPFFNASDGRSGAVITRAHLQERGGGRWSINNKGSHAYFRLVPGSPLGTRMRIDAGRSLSARVEFNVSPGEYEFLVGYAEGVHESKALASKRFAFAVTGSGEGVIE
jgi:hypothetical protein